MARRIPRYTEDKVAKKKRVDDEQVGVRLNRISPTVLIALYQGKKSVIDVVGKRVIDMVVRLSSRERRRKR